MPMPVGPRYFIVKSALMERIADLSPHAVFPTERALAEEFGTSRTTIRRAVAELVVEGQLIRTQGRGTFVAPPQHSYVRELVSFSEDVDVQGRQTRSRVLDVSYLIPDAEAQANLQLPYGQKVHRVERVRLLDGIPHAHEVAFLSGRFPNLKSLVDDTTSLYALLTSHYGIRFAEVEDTVETALASPTDALMLGIEVGAPVLVVQRVATDTEGTPVELTCSRFRGGRSRLVARLKI